jgi:hypothetical protein
MALDRFGYNNGPGEAFINDDIEPTGTNVRLFSGIPLDVSQQDQMLFSSANARETYFANWSNQRSVSEYSYQRTERRLRLGINVEQARNYNYMAFQNSDYGTRWFYAFITDVNYSNRNACYVSFKLDVFQTWFFDLTFKESFVRRQHLNQYRSSSLGVKVPFQRNDDEGLAYGDDYEIVGMQQITPEDPNVKWLVIASTVDLATSGESSSSSATSQMDFPGSANGVATPFWFYLLPFRTDDPTHRTSTTYGGKVLLNPDVFLEFIATSTSFASKIASITVTDWCPVGMNGTYPAYSVATNADGNITTLVTPELPDNLSSWRGRSIIQVTNNRSGFKYDINLGNPYKYFRSYGASKLLESPYAYLELTDFKGHMVMIKPEYVHAGNLQLRVIPSLSWLNKTAYVIRHYNISDTIGDIETNGTYGNTIISLDHAIYDNASGDIPVATEQAATYIQANKNALATAKTNMRMKNTANTAMSGINGAIQGAQAGIGGGPLGILAGAAIGGAVSGGSAAYQGHVNYQALTNTQNAKLADIDNMPDNISGMGNNPIFDANAKLGGVYLVWKQVKQEYAEKLVDYFHMFGYKYNKLVNLGDFTTAFHNRQRFNYVQTQNIHVIGNVNSNDLQEIKDIFDKGITLWHEGYTPGDYGSVNAELYPSD